MSTQGTHITDDTTVRGSITSASSITVAGEVEGDVTASGRVVVLGDGVVRGNLAGSEVVVHGKIEGNVAASGKLALTKSAVVHGDVRCRALEVEEGGMLLGRCDMGKGEAARTELPTAAPRQPVAPRPTPPTAPPTALQTGVRGRLGGGLPPPPEFGGASK